MAESISRELPLINEKKLVWGGNGLALVDEGDIDTGPGSPTAFLEIRGIRTCETVNEVVDLFLNPPDPRGRASGGPLFKKWRPWPFHWDNAITSWADGNGDIVMIEQMHDYFNAVFENPEPNQFPSSYPDILWHANHHQWNGETNTGSKTPEQYESSGERAEMAKELLKNY